MQGTERKLPPHDISILWRVNYDIFMAVKILFFLYEISWHSSKFIDTLIWRMVLFKIILFFVNVLALICKQYLVIHYFNQRYKECTEMFNPKLRHKLDNFLQKHIWKRQGKDLSSSKFFSTFFFEHKKSVHIDIKFFVTN